MASQFYSIKTRLRAVGPGNTRPIQSRCLMGISLPSSVPVCIRMVRVPTHLGLPSSSAAPSLWSMGLTPAFLLCTQEPWIYFRFLEVLMTYRETRIHGKIRTLNKLPLPKPLLYIQAIMTGVCQERRIQHSPSATCLLMAALAKSTTCSTHGCEIQPGRSI